VSLSTTGIAGPCKAFYEPAPAGVNADGIARLANAPITEAYGSLATEMLDAILAVQLPPPILCHAVFAGESISSRCVHQEHVPDSAGRPSGCGSLCLRRRYMIS